MNLFYNDDIFEYIIIYINISEYDKLKNVSYSFRNIFDLKYLIDNKSFNKLICITGCTERKIINIIVQTIICKYNVKRKNRIVKNFFKYGDMVLLNVSMRSRFPIIIENLIELIYNSAYKKYRNILKILKKVQVFSTVIILSGNKDYNDISSFIHFCFSILREFDNYSHKMCMLYKLNIGIFIFILVKTISNSLRETGCAIDFNVDVLFNLHNKKLTEYIDFLKNPINNNLFPSYYYKLIVSIIEILYI